MINDAINCEDKFYLMGYNKVYTVSQLISEYRKGSNKKRFVGIKRIIDSDCSGEITKFPINDAQHDPDLIYTLYMIMMIIILLNMPIPSWLIIHSLRNNFFTYNFFLTQTHTHTLSTQK